MTCLDSSSSLPYFAEPLSSVSSLEVHFDLMDLTELTDMSDQELAEVFADSDEESHGGSPAGNAGLINKQALRPGLIPLLFLLSLLPVQLYYTVYMSYLQDETKTCFKCYIFLFRTLLLTSCGHDLRCLRAIWSLRWRL